MTDRSKATDSRCDFAALWAESYARLRTYVRIFVPSVHDADDVMQETAMAIARDFDKYDPQRPFLEWAVGVARNRVFEHFRKRDRDRRMVFDVETVKHIEESFLAAESQFDSYHDALELCLKQLPERARRLIDLRYLACNSIEEISSQLGLTVRSVYTRLSQVRCGLKECIGRRMKLLGDAR
ncbi:RNA polymerase sigma factor CnrH [Posidoniimonas corsicana]|uniref:RNA polymerase sigma factor CnrH n=1 Tax=Posidoniimonas corsicana TaxID=1938618 RepID=A0A5C5UTG0_9BACT|nr:sigma-70 family RNA polymerase sigma factor [Posidoniimonas corsicana]TWT29338.1 RNA polymerase sigma factor CnrH [Posidoniimonas corsicana]